MNNENLAFRCMENPFLIGKDNEIFFPHDELGFVVGKGDFVGEREFVDWNSTLEMLKAHPDFPAVLNMGDSSTSGWHSDSLSRSGKNRLTDPYFHYKTYSDLMREGFMHVVNAGVSKYSSFQGAKYLSHILKGFSKQGVYLNFVTFYFGNNDCVYSQIEDKTAIDSMLPSENFSFQRVTPEDFEHNVCEMIRLSRCYGALPVIIVPLRRYDWAPGLRSLKYADEYEHGLEQLKPEELREKLEKARGLYFQGELEEACEADIFLPRIKARYVRVLRKIARKQRVDIVDVQEQIDAEQSSRFFCDYCHPIEPANKLICERFMEIARKHGNKQQRRKLLDIFSSRAPRDDVYPMW